MTENPRSHFSVIRMISEKRSQRNKTYKLVMRELDQIQIKATTDRQLEEVDIDHAEEAVVKASADVK